MLRKSITTSALERLELNFYGRGDATAWRRFIEEGKFTDATKEGRFPSANFVALPRTVKPDAHYLTGGFHPSGPKGAKLGDVHWHVTLLRCPEAKAPERMVKNSRQIAGVSGFWKRMGELWPEQAAVQVETSGTFDVSKLKLKIPGHDAKAGKFSVPMSGKKGAHTLTPTILATSWKVAPPLGIVNDVTLIGNGRGADRAVIKGVLTSLVEPTMIEVALVELWRSLSLFKPTP